MLICPKCNQAYDETFSFCPHCGNPTVIVKKEPADKKENSNPNAICVQPPKKPKKLFCSVCGAKNENENADFCPYCGNPFNLQLEQDIVPSEEDKQEDAKESILICPFCGFENNSANVEYCSHCSNRLSTKEDEPVIENETFAEEAQIEEDSSICKFCGYKNVDEAAVFCTHCGSPLPLKANDEEKKEEQNEAPCEKVQQEEQNSSLINEAPQENAKPKIAFCPGCGTKNTNENALFCSVCGRNFATGENKIINKFKENELISNLKQDFDKSQFIKTVKKKTVSLNKKVKINKKALIAIISSIVALILILTVALNIHVCDWCEGVRFSKNTITLFGDEIAVVCNECYDYF